jgi:glutamate/tyrosine decarboxylase-like PLP-dependent enzyme
MTRVMTQRLRIPAEGRSREELLTTMDGYRAEDARWQDGRCFSLVYWAGEEHERTLLAAHERFFMENALNPMAFKSLKRMESEVVQMTASMLHAPPEAVGTMTSGGTESLLMAVKTYRERARAKRPWVRTPEMVAPDTIHPAVDKAAHYFGVRLRRARVEADGRVDVDDMRRLINRNTVLLLASAPQYPHGVLDPIEAIGALAERQGLPLHVDACIGGFMLPWVERLGYPMRPFDFRVPGVTSMSADLHKYGLAAKGASTIVYRDMSYLRHQFFVATEFPGGIYASPSALGTRPGGTIAAAWAALMSLGEEGYLRHTRLAMEATEKLRAGVAAIEGLAVHGKPAGTIFAYKSTDARVDLFAVADQLAARGWHVDRQHRPPTIHLTVTSQHLAHADEYLADLRASVEHVRAHPGLRSSGNAAMYGMMARIPFPFMVKGSVRKVMEAMYGPAGTDTDPMHTDDSAVTRFLTRHADTVMSVLDRLQALRTRRRDVAARSQARASSTG